MSDRIHKKPQHHTEKHTPTEGVPDIEESKIPEAKAVLAESEAVLLRISAILKSSIDLCSEQI